jgi:hypothetical protein
MKVFLQQGRHYPGFTHMLDQRLRFVLHQQVNCVNARIDQVGQHKIDDAITCAKGNGWLGTFRSQWMQARTFAASDDHGQNFFITTHAPSLR